MRNNFDKRAKERERREKHEAKIEKRLQRRKQKRAGAIRAASPMSSNTAFIWGVPYDADREEVRSLLAGCAGVVLLCDPSGGNPHRGCGFVQFATASRLRDALALCSGTSLSAQTHDMTH